jgi:hypothetical protein
MKIDDLPKWFFRRGEPADAVGGPLDAILRLMLVSADCGIVVVGGPLPDGVPACFA